jgi:hypothetical protein
MNAIRIVEPSMLQLFDFEVKNRSIEPGPGHAPLSTSALCLHQTPPLSAKWCEWSWVLCGVSAKKRKGLEGDALPPSDKTRGLCRVGCLSDRSYRYRSWSGSCVSLGVRESKVWARISFMGVRLAPRYRALRFSGHVPLCWGTATWHEQAGGVCG